MVRAEWKEFAVESCELKEAVTLKRDDPTHPSIVFIVAGVYLKKKKKHTRSIELFQKISNSLGWGFYTEAETAQDCTISLER